MSDAPDVQFASNDVRLSPPEWIVALGLIVACLGLAPVLWERVEPLRIEPNHRLPFSLGSDYWTYGRLCRAATARGKTLVVGDSVVWGHYVAKDQTLSAHLNRLAGEERFANLGVDGIHPAAMAGLIEYYGQAISGRSVILHCNFLWMSSKRHDLQEKKEFAFNHPTLVPQFSPPIPCYKETYSRRLDIAIERRLPFPGWKNHLQVAYFRDGNVPLDIPAWTLKHPYADPLGAITLALPSPDEPPSPRPVAEPWTQQGITKFNPPWVELEKSFQWASFMRTVEVLQRRGNRVFVLVGPFNEHMLKEPSLEAYRKLRSGVQNRLQKEGIPHYVPDVLPSGLYADASHPLAEGYGQLAKQLFDNEAFARFGRSAGGESGVKPPHSKASAAGAAGRKDTRGPGFFAGVSARFGVRWLDAALGSQRSGETCEGPDPSWRRTR